MTEPAAVKDDLNDALRTLVDDLRANRPAALEKSKRGASITPRTYSSRLTDELGGVVGGDPSDHSSLATDG
jgi:hypothetical protein